VRYRDAYKKSSEEVVEEYRSLVVRIARQVKSKLPPSANLDDLIQEGMIGLLDAASKFSGAIRVLEQRLGRYPKAREVAEELEIGLAEYYEQLQLFGSFLSLDDLSSTAPPDSLTSAASGAEEFVNLKKAVRARIESLPQKQQVVVALHYQFDMSYREIAAAMNLSVGRISQLHSEAMTFLKAGIEN